LWHGQKPFGLGKKKAWGEELYSAKNDVGRKNSGWEGRKLGGEGQRL